MKKKDTDPKTQDVNELPISPGSEPSEQRRRLLSKLFIGGAAGMALPAKWTKPIVSSVVLPAHAQISPPPTAAPEPGPRIRIVRGGGNGAGQGGPGPAPTGSLSKDILDFLLNPAEAQPSLQPLDYWVEIEVTETDGAITKVTVTKWCYNQCGFPEDGGFERSVLKNVNGGSYILQSGGQNPVTLTPDDVDLWTGEVDGFAMRITSVNPDGSPMAKVRWNMIESDIILGSTNPCICEDV